MILALILGTVTVGLSIAIGWYSRKWLVRRSADVQAAVDSALKECAIQHRCVIKQAADTKDWTDGLTKKMQKELAKRERRRAKEDVGRDGQKG